MAVCFSEGKERAHIQTKIGTGMYMRFIGIRVDRCSAL